MNGQLPQPQQKDTVYINYFDGIDMDRVRMLMAVCTKVLAEFKPKKLYFLFASPGGQVAAGIALYNFLKSIPPKIVMHNMSSVDSIGTVVFLAGDERYASPNTTFLFHGVEMQFQQGASLNMSKMEEIKSGLSEDQNKIAGIIAENTNITVKEIQELFAQGETKSLDFAKNKGFIDEVKTVSLSEEDVLISVSFQNKQ
jgi:ATP-dependent protease ClpP protease subunit